MIDGKKTQNKKMEPQEVKAKVLQTYSYPDYGVSIEAENREEADEKLQEIINNK